MGVKGMPRVCNKAVAESCPGTAKVLALGIKSKSVCMPSLRSLGFQPPLLPLPPHSQVLVTMS